MDIGIASSLVELVVSNFLRTSLPNSDVSALRSGPDFEVVTGTGRTRTLIEVRGTVRDHGQMDRLARLVRKAAQPGDRFILVTPSPPDEPQAAAFAEVMGDQPFDATWVPIQQLPDVLGVPSPGDLLSPETMARLQTASLVSSVERYSAAPIGPGSTAVSDAVGNELVSMTRQFGYDALASIAKDNRPLEDVLRVGQRVDQVTIVLSDVVNFSTLVTASNSDELREFMGRYYRLAREAVFKHGGMLDKFIGDAVLAVFGYPVPGALDAVSAVRFAKELTLIGQEVLGAWQEELNAPVGTGTRIGIATGELWPINIGSSQVEITLLGDTINLAARLEKNCEPDNLLMDNRTKQKVTREDAAFVGGLGLTQIMVQPGEAKGQLMAIRAWTIDGAGVG